MKRLFIIGNGPLPNEENQITNASGLRTWQFVEPLLKNQSYQITLISIRTGQVQTEIKKTSNLIEHKIDKNDPHLFKKIKKLFQKQQPEILIGINTFPSYLASKLNPKIPFWADLNGWIMAEAQAQAYKMQNNNYLHHYFEMEKNILAKADRISTVSNRQKFAVAGELAFLGRLNYQNFHHDFISHIPNSAANLKIEHKKSKTKIIDPKKHFVISWIGGYNTWVDEKTLFEGIDAAMAKNSNIHFISTGGTIEGLDDSTFGKFQAMVKKSKFKSNYHFLGWIEKKDLSNLYQISDVGLNVDHLCLETETGARNRLNEMMQFRLPIITSDGSEISAIITEHQIGLSFPNGNAKAFTKAILTMADLKTNDPAVLKLYSQHGQKYIQNYCNYEVTTKPLQQWLKNPITAPDKGKTINLNQKNLFKSSLQYLKTNGIKKSLTKLIQKAYN